MFCMPELRDEMSDAEKGVILNRGQKAGKTELIKMTGARGWTETENS